MMGCGRMAVCTTTIREGGLHDAIQMVWEHVGDRKPMYKA